MSYIKTITVSVLPGRVYKISAPAVASVYYSGQLVGGTGTLNTFVAIEGVNTLRIETPSQLTGTITLTRILRSYYEPYDGQGGTWSFQPGIDKWTSQYSFRPEWMCMVGNRLVTFNGGTPYIHAGVQNTFYGNVYDSVVAISHSEANNIVKTYRAAAVAGTNPDRMHFRTEDPNVQSSDLVGSEFVIKEGLNYSAVYRDRLSPNVTGNFNQKLNTGDPVRGEVLKSMVVYESANTPKEVRHIGIEFSVSRGHGI